MDIKCNDRKDQRDRLQVLASATDDCCIRYEQALLDKCKPFRRSHSGLRGFHPKKTERRISSVHTGATGQETVIYSSDLGIGLKPNRNSDRVHCIGPTYGSELNNKYKSKQTFTPAQGTVALHTGLTDEGWGRTVIYSDDLGVGLGPMLGNCVGQRRNLTGGARPPPAPSGASRRGRRGMRARGCRSVRAITSEHWAARLRPRRDRATRRCCARGRPIIVEWERDARHSAGLSLVRIHTEFESRLRENRPNEFKSNKTTRFVSRECTYPQSRTLSSPVTMSAAPEWRWEEVDDLYGQTPQYAVNVLWGTSPQWGDTNLTPTYIILVNTSDSLRF
ncbi:hypothetical protein EVAR_6234_1 [Eumeta japonica]|uniref:Uncharacterized protein n=1 Tax=Eumeta variegata TaxID=151549 RepID=A0A4C1T927_EUMVA|nr:hypothetical protein EVAR_6234_1 [Eumeta japonica]